MNETHDINAATTTPAPHPIISAKRAKFEEIATRRTKSAIAAIRNISTLGGRNRYAYEFGKNDVDKIVEALMAEVETLRNRMVSPGRQLDIEFDL